MGMLTLALVLLSALQGHAQLSQRTSPLGSAVLRMTPSAGDLHRLVFDLEVRESDGARHRIPGVVGNGFYITDVDRIVVLDACESFSVPTRLRVMDFAGHTLRENSVSRLTAPKVSSAGDFFAYRTPSSTVVLDLTTFAKTEHVFFDRYALLSDGSLIGALCEEQHAVRLVSASGEYRIQLDGPLRELIVTEASRTAMLFFEGGGRAVDLDNGTSVGFSTSGTITGAPAPPAMGGSHPSQPRLALPWPLGTNTQRAVGNTYAEYQNYGGSPYLHPGIDVLGADFEPVYAVSSGYVKAILTTSAQYHWRVAIGDSAGSGTGGGYLYAHLDEPTIAVNVGDFVTRGQYLGDLVPWPVANFTHCHFARIEDQGVQWSGNWLCTRNPHTRLRDLTENTPPVFENALGSDAFAFCHDETSNYLDPADLNGIIDVIVKVSDQIASPWVCSVEEIRYSIFPAAAPEAFVVENKLAVRFDMPLDTYQGGPMDPFLVDLLYKEDSVCNTNGDYISRDFYHVITNSNGDDDFDAGDLGQAWDTSSIPDGNYIIEVTAWDAAGNSAVQQMQVTVDNDS